MDNDQNEEKIKIIFLHESGAGATAIINVLVRDIYDKYDEMNRGILQTINIITNNAILPVKTRILLIFSTLFIFRCGYFFNCSH